MRKASTRYAVASPLQEDTEQLGFVNGEFLGKEKDPRRAEAQLISPWVDEMAEIYAIVSACK